MKLSVILPVYGAFVVGVRVFFYGSSFTAPPTEMEAAVNAVNDSFASCGCFTFDQERTVVWVASSNGSPCTMNAPVKYIQTGLQCTTPTASTIQSVLSWILDNYEVDGDNQGGDQDMGNWHYTLDPNAS